MREVKNVKLKDIVDVMYEPDKNKYSVLIKNSRRVEISKGNFYDLINESEEKNS